jgi:hypothetical protein
MTQGELWKYFEEKIASFEASVAVLDNAMYFTSYMDSNQL